MNGTRMVVEFNEDSPEAMVLLDSGDGASCKTVAATDLVAALVKDFQISTGLLPAGAKFFMGSRAQYHVGVEVPPAVRTAHFSLMDEGKFSILVPFPALLFVFEVSGKRLVKSLVFACMPPLVGGNDQLYWFPLGNVNDSGSICWGHVQHPEIIEPISLDGAVSKFFSSVFSGHLIRGTDAFNPPEGVFNLKSLLEHLEGKSHFPDSILKPAGKRLRDVMVSNDDGDD